MQVFDASSMILAWDNYPIENFPGFWGHISFEIENSRIAIPYVAFDEIRHVSPECGDWLRAQQIEILPMNNSIVAEAARLKALIGVIGDKYHPNGVGENDLFIVATAKCHGHILVSNELQPTRPSDTRRYKIPSVCSMNTVNVTCWQLIDFIRRSDQRF